MCREIKDAPLLIDVGTDHALLPLAWLAEHPASRAIGIDRGEMPLGRAELNRAQSPDAARLQLRLQDGLGEWIPDTAGAVLSISGMGGITMSGILERARAVREQRLARLVLGPNDRFFELRQTLQSLGWQIRHESACWERKRFYPVVTARPRAPQDALLDETELRYGPCLLRQAHPGLAQWLVLQHQRLCKIATQSHSEAPPQLQAQIQSIRGAWNHYFLDQEGPLSPPRD